MIEMENSNNLTIINNTNIEAVESTLNSIVQFQNVVRATLKQEIDFGKIPGCGKPSLLKPGAEKITMLLGLKTKFEIVNQQQDIEKGFFRYQVKAILIKNDEVITEGFGSANTKESKWANSKKSAFTLDNTVLKMAKKRALVDAVLLVASLSEVFTQDIEDIEKKDDNITKEYEQLKKDNAYIKSEYDKLANNFKKLLDEYNTIKNNTENENEVLSKIKNILYIVAEKDENKAIDLLELHSKFTTKDGKDVKGIRDFKLLNDKRSRVIYGTLKKIYPDTYKYVIEKMKKQKEAS